MTLSKSMHEYADAKLATAGELLAAARASIPTPPEYANFERALRIIDDCRSNIASDWEVDALAESLRAASAQLRDLCGGPAEASVNAAIDLVDQAIGGETI